MLFLLFLASFSLYKKHPLAKYIFTAWIINCIGLCSLALNQYGIITPIDYFPYCYELCTFLEAIIFSTALASKLNKTKELEKSVKKNVILTRELHHRVKNNLQFIILIYRLKLANLKNEEINQKLKESEGSIQAISKTHEILYNQENLKDMDTKLYFQNLLDEIKKGFIKKEIKINLNISININIKQAMYCGIILNELITNSFKYAFKTDKGVIDIKFFKENGLFRFIIQDNGIGFNYKENSNNSFGLSFVKAIVEDELRGKITYIKHKGSKTSISF